MTTTADPGSLGDDDIRAFGPPAVAAAPMVSQPVPKKRRLWLWFVLAAAVFAVIGALVLATQLVTGIGEGIDGWHMSIDDELVFGGAASVFGMALAIGITAIVLLGVGALLALLFPMVLLLVLGLLALVIGLPLVLLLVLLAVLTSPLWLPIALLVWFLA
jgi:hypothetical protein